jgi:WD40 repeat protein
MSVKFSYDGAYITSASLDSTIKIWFSNNGTLYRTLTGHTAGV